MTESDIQAEIMLSCGRGDVRLFRNTCGAGWMGEVVSNRGGIVTLRNARFTRFGLMPGSGDLIGWKSLLISETMVGQSIAQFASLEVKTLRGTAAAAQDNWRQRVCAAGGIGGVARSPSDALFLLSGEQKHHGKPS